MDQEVVTQEKPTVKPSKIRDFMLKHPISESDELTFSPTLGQVKYWIRVINKEIFDNELPDFTRIEFKDHSVWNDWAACNGLTNKFGTRYCYLEISDKFRNKREFIEILIHEMVHHHQWVFHRKMNHHGPCFKAWRKKIEEFGAILLITY